MKAPTFAGDETAELLAQDVMQIKTLAPSPEPRQLLQNGTPKSLNGTPVRSTPQSPLGRPHSEASRTLKRLRNLKNTPAKRAKRIPRLLLDPDLEEDLEPTQFSVSATDSQNLSESTIQELGPLNGLNLKLDPEYSTVEDLCLELQNKNHEIKVLKEAIASLVQNQERELDNVYRRLHREYSRQASERLRVLRSRAEEKAQRDAAEQYRTEIGSLKKQIHDEREEKSQLVRACDEYLSYHGF